MLIKGDKKLTREQCDKIDGAEQAKALAWVDKNVHVPLTEPQDWYCRFVRGILAPVKCFIDVL